MVTARPDVRCELAQGPETTRCHRAKAPGEERLWDLHTHTHAHAHTHTCSHTHTHTHAHTHTLTHAHTLTCTHSHSHTHTRAQSHAHTLTRTHTYIHAHTHSLTQQTSRNHPTQNTKTKRTNTAESPGPPVLSEGKGPACPHAPPLPPLSLARHSPLGVLQACKSQVTAEPT